MKKTVTIMAVAVSVVVLAASCVMAGGDQKTDDGAKVASKGKSQTVCPVMGGAINRSVYVDVDGKRIYLCCAGCIKAVKDDPAKYLKKLADDGVEPEPAPNAKKD